MIIHCMMMFKASKIIHTPTKCCCVHHSCYGQVVSSQSMAMTDRNNWITHLQRSALRTADKITQSLRKYQLGREHFLRCCGIISTETCFHKTTNTQPYIYIYTHMVDQSAPPSCDVGAVGRTQASHVINSKNITNKICTLIQIFIYISLFDQNEIPPVQSLRYRYNRYTATTA